MLIRKLDPESLVSAYNVDLQVLYPWEGVVEPPFGAAWAVLAPGESTKPHAHQECETFFVARGEGLLAIGEERQQVGPGSVSFHPPFNSHILTNTSSDEELLFLTVWWEDKGRWAGESSEGPQQAAADSGSREGAAALPAAPGVRPGLRRALVTAAPPTPNGDLHIGHLSGPYLAGDVHARYLRAAGVDAHFVFGTDDNSEYVQSQGQAMGLGPQQAGDHFADAIDETLAAANIHRTVLPRPNRSAHHRQLVVDFFTALVEADVLEVREGLAPFDAETGAYLFEPYIGGACPGCGEGVVGNTCEACGLVYDAAEIVDGRATGSDQAPELKPVRRFVFPLSRYHDALREYLRHVEMTPRLRAFCLQRLEAGLPDIVVTHPTDWGIAVPVEGWEDQRIYVWLEMAARYFAYSADLDEFQAAAGDAEAAADGSSWRRWWSGDQSAIHQFFGFDNSFYYGLLLPALYHAFDSSLQPAAAMTHNEFYRLDGLKFSTSRDHRILGRDLVAQAPRDAVRFFLGWTAPEREETNFTLEAFRELAQRQLTEGWLSWLEALGQRLRENGGVPSTGDWTNDQRRFYHRLEELLEDVGLGYAVPGFSLQRSARALAEIAREARRFAAGEAAWAQVASRGEERRTALALEALAAKALAVAAAPLMPDFAAALGRALGVEDISASGAWQRALDWVPSGTEVGGLDAESLLAGLGDYLESSKGA
ncbi:MAG: class I tRNA ligase family protein [Acidobacteriota bacterium]